MMHLKIKSSWFPVKGLLTTLGATLILISLALDFSYGKFLKMTKKSHLNFRAKMAQNDICTCEFLARKLK